MDSNKTKIAAEEISIIDHQPEKSSDDFKELFMKLMAVFELPPEKTQEIFEQIMINILEENEKYRSHKQSAQDKSEPGD